MAKQPRITIIQPDAKVPLCRFEKWLPDAKVRFSIVGLWEKDVPPLPSLGDGLLVLGGRMSAQAHSEHRWIDPLNDLIADAHSIELPILGICLGHQLIAEALGGRVQVDDPAGGEEGPVSLNWLPDAAADPIFGPIAAGGQITVAESHHDVVAELPAGATELARSQRYPNQVFRLGNTWGVQFHPEADPELIAFWADKPDQARILAQLRQLDAEIYPPAQQIASGFAMQVRGE